MPDVQYKAACCCPKSRIRPLFSPRFLLSPTVATYHRFGLHPTLGRLLSLALSIIASILSFNIGLWRLFFYPFLFLSPSLSRFGHHRIDSAAFQHWALVTALLPLPFSFPASSLSLWPSSHRFCLFSTLGFSNYSSPLPFPFLASSLPGPLWLPIIDLVYVLHWAIALLSPAWLSSIRSSFKSDPQTRSSVSQNSLNPRIDGLVIRLLNRD